MQSHAVTCVGASNTDLFAVKVLIELFQVPSPRLTYRHGAGPVYDI